MYNRSIVLPKNHSFFLFGPRLTGKSTLLKATFPKSSTFEINLLLSSDYLRYSSYPALFYQDIKNRGSEKTHVIVDEIQRLPELLNDIHAIIEEPNSPFFCLSGSSARKLKRANANLLAGRAWSFNLFPLVHTELKDKFNLEMSLSRGTLPPMVLAENEIEARRSLTAYVDTYLKEEIHAEAAVRNTGAFHRFLPIAADYNGQIINYSTIAGQTGINYNTVKDYFTILEDTFLGFYLFPYIGKTAKRLTKHPKFYLFDTGIARALKGLAAVPILPQTEDYGHAFEHFIILETIRLSQYAEKDYRFYYYRVQNGELEVDLIIETPQKELFAVEIKSSSMPASKQLRGLISFKKDNPHAKLLCVCETTRAFQDRDVEFIPWQDFFTRIGL